MTVNEYIKRTTPRLHRAYLAWIEMQWDRPSRTDYYIMQATSEVIRSNQRIKNPNSVKISDLVLPFGDSQRSDHDDDSISDEERLARSKSFWTHRNEEDKPIVVKQVSKEQATKAFDEIASRFPIFLEPAAGSDEDDFDEED